MIAVSVRPIFVCILLYPRYPARSVPFHRLLYQVLQGFVTDLTTVIFTRGKPLELIN